jgi:hypothetical protein
VSTLHERLVAELDEFDRLLVHPVRFNTALRAVVELHAPKPHKYVPAVIWCGRCDLPADRCVEARAIAEALGIGETP